MIAYLVKRVLEVVPVLFILVSAVFLLVNVAGDPVASMLGDDATPEQIAAVQHSLGLDRPIVVQYADYVGSVVRGDFGDSYRFGESALALVIGRLPVTLTLAITGIAIAIAFAVPAGVVAAVRRGGILDRVLSAIAVLGKAMPNFWLGIMLILLFAVQLRMLPVSGAGGWTSVILPSIAIATGVAAEIAMLVRTSVIEELGNDYVRTARGKGLTEGTILRRHALRNAFVPVASIVLLQFANLVGGTIIVETVFSWPGLGQLLVNAVSNKDLPVVQAGVFVIALMIIIVNVCGDIVFRLSDRRIRF
ncbi:ABC transporter permease [Microbacterium sp. gxy059]|uniref:ABC transporter permease n=1 Tax=Microbacterium sp. gxy059 TaxID=2957199 RepID=UPI003D952551